MLASQIKTASDLRAFVEDRGTDSHFFDRKTMKFFGDTMRNYGVCKTNIVCAYDKDGNYVAEGVRTEVWELYRKRPVKHGLQGSVYFRTNDFVRVYQR